MVAYKRTYYSFRLKCVLFKTRFGKSLPIFKPYTQHTTCWIGSPFGIPCLTSGDFQIIFFSPRRLPGFAESKTPYAMDKVTYIFFGTPNQASCAARPTASAVPLAMATPITLTSAEVGTDSDYYYGLVRVLGLGF